MLISGEYADNLAIVAVSQMKEIEIIIMNFIENSVIKINDEKHF